MKKMTYKKALGVVTLLTLLVGLVACGSPKAKNDPAPEKVTHQSVQKPVIEKIPEAFAEGKEGTFEAIGEVKPVIWDDYPDQLADVKDAFYHWTGRDDWFHVQPGHYIVVDRLNSSGALLKKLEKGAAVKLNGKEYTVVDYKEFEGNGSEEKLLTEFKDYIKDFPKSAYFVQTCLDASTYGGQRLVVIDVAK